MKNRRNSKQIYVGSVPIGGGAPIVIQSMTNTKTVDVDETLRQITSLADAGCEIVRCAIPDMAAAEAIKEITQNSPVPIIGDIHFDYRLALRAMENGIDGIRINPGNIGDEKRIAAVIDGARGHNIPLRIGVNGGSLEKDLLAQYGPTPEAMVASALREIAVCERHNFYNIKISLKSSSVLTTIAAYELLAEKVEYPLHLGVTEAGTVLKGSIKSALGIGILLNEGIGDTIRVSLTGDPVAEILVAKEILRDLGLRQEGIEIISCPTCGRTNVDLSAMAEKAEKELSALRVKRALTVAVMGCEVNGPGEAKEADYGIACGRGFGLLLKGGQTIGKYDEHIIIDKLLEEIRRNEI